MTAGWRLPVLPLPTTDILSRTTPALALAGDDWIWTWVLAVGLTKVGWLLLIAPCRSFWVALHVTISLSMLCLGSGEVACCGHGEKRDGWLATEVTSWGPEE